MAIRVQGNSRRTGGIVHQGTIEEDFTRWWCHLAAVCVFCCLDLLWGGHGASGDGGFPWVLWCGRRNTELWCGEMFRTRRLAGVTDPVDINVVIDDVGAMFNDGS